MWRAKAYMPKRTRPYGFKLEPPSLHLRFTLYYYQPSDQKYIQYTKIIRQPAAIITHQVIKSTSSTPKLFDSLPLLSPTR
ncbi:hypothetical protein C1H46_045351 [Malus baccata]|uniref:Uncharacterized protein n=1 Tax=Malus baccata TaxID=106549 RepID=A0A540K4G3_MALBA|nr:hypothetical protein C1H46_045351 [Malus baccata]